VAPPQPQSRPRPTAATPAQPKATGEAFVEHYRARSEARNVVARAGLTPLEPGEHPWPLLVAIALTTLIAVGNLVAYAAGAKIAGKHPGGGGIIVFSAVMLVCAIGMWRHWYQAVLAFMVLLAIVVVLFSLFLVEASNLLGFLIPPFIIIGGGYLFWKLVRVLGRLQMPQRPGG
jgi:hypothetical protein